MTISAEPAAAMETIKALRTIRYELGCHTSLGVCNVSFGLPKRDTPSTVHYLYLCYGKRTVCGHHSNPYSQDMMKAYYAFKALHQMDENCSDYITFVSNLEEPAAPAVPAASDVPSATVSAASGKQSDYASPLQRAIAKGLKEKAGELTEAMLADTDPLEIIQNQIIPALDIVGKGFEEKTVYLPQLLMSAEAAKASF